MAERAGSALEPSVAGAPPRVHGKREPLHGWDAGASPCSHIWYPQQSRHKDICSRCLTTFSRLTKDGVKCGCCHVRQHRHCTAASGVRETVCRPTFTSAAQLRLQQDARAAGEPPAVLNPHHWVSGLYEKSKVCDVCSKSVRPPHTAPPLATHAAATNRS